MIMWVVILVWVYLVLLLSSNSKLMIRLGELALALQFYFVIAGHPSYQAALALWDGLLIINGLLLTLELFLLGLAIVIIAGQWQGQPLNTLLLMANVMGIVYLLASKDWLATVAAWELFNLALYLVAGFRGLQYFLVSALATTFLLLGVAMIYALTGTTHYEGLQTLSNVNVNLALGFIATAFLVKLGAAPFHSWAPDLYSGLALPVTLWFALLPKLAILGVLWSLAINSLIQVAYPGYLSLLCFLVGSVGLAGQWQIGRFIAYSAVVHVGYFLLAYGNLAFASYIFYAFIYALTVLNLFLVICSGSAVRGGRYNFQFLTRTRSNRALAVAFAISAFSLAAIPPLAGFYAKLTILAEELHPLAILAVLASTLSAANYLTLVLLAILDLKVEPDFHFSLVLPPLTGYLIATLTLILSLAFVVI